MPACPERDSTNGRRSGSSRSSASWVARHSRCPYALRTDSCGTRRFGSAGSLATTFARSCACSGTISRPARTSRFQPAGSFMSFQMPATPASTQRLVLRAPPGAHVGATEVGQRRILRPHLQRVRRAVAVAQEHVARLAVAVERPALVGLHARVDDRDDAEARFAQLAQQAARIREAARVPGEDAVGVHVVDVEVDHVGRDAAAARLARDAAHVARAAIAPARLVMPERPERRARACGRCAPCSGAARRRARAREDRDVDAARARRRDHAQPLARRDVEVAGRAAVEQQAVGARRLAFGSPRGAAGTGSSGRAGRRARRRDDRDCAARSCGRGDRARPSCRRVRTSARPAPRAARRGPRRRARRRSRAGARSRGRCGRRRAPRRGPRRSRRAPRRRRRRRRARCRLPRGAPSAASIANGSAFDARHGSRPSASDGSGGNARPVAARTRTAPSRATSTRATASPRSRSTAPRAAEVQRCTAATAANCVARPRRLTAPILAGATPLRCFGDVLEGNKGNAAGTSPKQRRYTGRPCLGLRVFSIDWSGSCRSPSSWLERRSRRATRRRRGRAPSRLPLGRARRPGAPGPDRGDAGDRSRRPDRRRALGRRAGPQYRAVRARTARQSRAALRRARHGEVVVGEGPAPALRGARAAPRRGAQGRPDAAARRGRRAARAAVPLPGLLRRPLLRRRRSRHARAEGRARGQRRDDALERAHHRDQQSPPPGSRVRAREPRRAPRRRRRAPRRRSARGEARAGRPLRPGARLLRLRPAHLSAHRRALRRARPASSGRASSSTPRRCASH